MKHYLLSKKEPLTHYLFLFLILFLPLFTFGVFGPSEIFFGNYNELGFVYGEFGWTFLIAAIIISVLAAVLLFFLPNIIQKIIIAVLWGFSIAGYIQTMFLNKGLDQIGVSAEGYTADSSKIIFNILFWGIILCAAAIFIFVCKKNWKKVVLLTSAILLGIQLTGYISLFITADKTAFSYPEDELCLSGAEQYTLSSNENIILFVLDNFSNSFLDTALETYPDVTSSLNDFTYYNNADCNYWGTYPSLPHLLTGNELDVSLSVNDWLKECWTNDVTSNYFSMLKSHNYKVNLYTPITDLLTGTQSLDLLHEKIDNVTPKSSTIQIDYKKLYQTMLQMSCYRFLPEYFKPGFDVNNEQYATIVSYPENELQYSNPNYYNGLLENGISLDNSSNFFTIQHLNGTHEFINDVNCQYDRENATCETTVKGIFTMINAYLEQLKTLGIYDNSTIIITADHGSEARSQVVFFIKERNETHDAMQITSAPITLDDLVPTIIQLLGEDHTEFGTSIHDYTPDQQRERTVYMRAYDETYPAVKRFDNVTEGGANVYHVYTYTGTRDNLNYMYDYYQYTTIPMTDSYF